MFQIGETYIVVGHGLDLVVIEKQERYFLKPGDELQYVGMRRVISGMPHTDMFRFKGNIGYVNPNDYGHANPSYFAQRKKRCLPEFEPYDPEKHLGKMLREERKNGCDAEGDTESRIRSEDGDEESL